MATLALEAGVHPKVVQEQLGHSAVAVTLDTYPQDLIHLEEALSELLGVSVDVISAAALLERDADIRRDAVAL